jgi:hypothetical protein
LPDLSVPELANRKSPPKVSYYLYLLRPFLSELLEAELATLRNLPLLLEKHMEGLAKGEYSQA